MDLETKFDILLTEMKNICNKIDDKFDKVDGRFEQMDKRFEQVDRRFEQVDNKINSLSAEIGAVHSSLSTEIGTLHRTFFKLDVETQNNLRILSDAVKQHNDKQLLFEKQLYRLNDQLDNTTFRVSVLEDNHSY